MKTDQKVIVACRALEEELERILSQLDFKGRVVYIQASLHLRPNKLRTELERVLEQACDGNRDVSVVFGKCFTGIEELCKRKEAKLTEGHHCFQMFLGNEYHKIVREEPGTYFFTHHFAENFHELCIVGLGLDRHPKMKELIFDHYKKALFIDTRGEGIIPAARDAAAFLELSLEYCHAGTEGLATALIEAGIMGKKTK